MRGAARRGAPPGKGRWGWGRAARIGGGAGGGGLGLSRNPLRATNFPRQRDIARGGGKDFSRWCPARLRRDPGPGCERPGGAQPGAAFGGGDRAALAPEPRGNELPPNLGCCWARSCRLEQVSPRWHREARCPPGRGANAPAFAVRAPGGLRNLA